MRTEHEIIKQKVKFMKSICKNEKEELVRDTYISALEWVLKE